MATSPLIQTHAVPPPLSDITTSSTVNSDNDSTTGTQPTTSTSSHSPAQLTKSITLSQGPARIVVKSTCNGELCNSTQVSGKCTRCRCKRCCLLLNTPCGFKAHDTDRVQRAAAVPIPSGDPFALLRPAPRLPYDVSTVSPTQAAGPASDTSLKTYQQVMPASVLKMWNAQQQAQ